MDSLIYPYHQKTNASALLEKRPELDVIHASIYYYLSELEVTMVLNVKGLVQLNKTHVKIYNMNTLDSPQVFVKILS